MKIEHELGTSFCQCFTVNWPRIILGGAVLLVTCKVKSSVISSVLSRILCFSVLFGLDRLRGKKMFYFKRAGLVRGRPSLTKGIPYLGCPRDLKSGNRKLYPKTVLTFSVITNILWELQSEF